MPRARLLDDQILGAYPSVRYRGPLNRLRPQQFACVSSRGVSVPPTKNLLTAQKRFGLGRRDQVNHSMGQRTLPLWRLGCLTGFVAFQSSPRDLEAASTRPLPSSIKIHYPALSANCFTLPWPLTAGPGRTAWLASSGGASIFFVFSCLRWFAVACHFSRLRSRCAKIAPTVSASSGVRVRTGCPRGSSYNSTDPTALNLKCGIPRSSPNETS